MNFRAANDRLLVEEIPDSDLSILSSGIIVERPAQITAKVISVGPGRPDVAGRYPMPAKEGDKVLLTKPCGLPVMVSGKKYLLIRDTDVLGVFGGD